MNESFTPAPNPFRDQYAGGVEDVPEFEAALSGSPAPRLSLRPVVQPLSRENIQPFVRLR